MDEKDYLKVTLNGFLLNAGVVGLLRLFEYAEEYDELGCVKDEDYIIDNQDLYISKKFILTHNLADLYVKSIVYYLGEDTKFIRVMSKQDAVNKLFEKYDPEDKKWIKDVNELFKEFSEMLEKASFKSGYEILASYDNVEKITLEMIASFKKEKDYITKKDLYFELCRLLNQPKVKEVLIFKDILYSKINMFMGDVSFLNRSNTKKDITQTYHNDFVQPLLDDLSYTKSKTKPCIDCGRLSKTTTSLSFMSDVTDDTNRKKSYYWNCVPDAYLCPLCAFIYSLVPLGFSYAASDAIFINSNINIKTLQSLSEGMFYRTDEADKNVWYKVYNKFTNLELSNVQKRIDNIQVIVRENHKDSKRYSLNMIDKQIVTTLANSKNELDYIRNWYVKDSDEFINVYQSTVEHIINRQSLYNFISRLLKISLRDGTNSNHLFPILIIQINSQGGQKMEADTKQAYVAKKKGEEMRVNLTKDVSTSDRDDKLKGMIYQFLNAVSLSNRDAFMNLLIRSYSSVGQPVPDIFFSCFESDEKFRTIGYAYLLGLKSDGYKKPKEGDVSE
ncbi:hypothetical protein A3206_01625 [Candidatus Methanomassiliicoccus intestinalis]|jgi:CRISPR-associated cxxc_cxxc protein Cst1|uniref:type I-B CRISPR-associated protein Cas8b1/Cst1 n=1 Tax=Candidatus Methanomassiliicoccus intestinalis TaxID=1406512 RepID=UPI0037DC1152|nr:MAG: hypothetical protein A3206_01625 [Candidatus Methanomassiliicoccus intestinalis]